jgi:SAM-dependent methyltransferase
MNAEEGVSEFYDLLAARYHYLFNDWQASIERHGRVLDQLLRQKGHDPAAGPILDMACGIGTQAIGLALLGWEVHGSDISAGAVDRAANESRSRGLRIETVVADMRTIDHSMPLGRFQAVLACDNSIAHLLSDDDLRSCLAASRNCLAAGGSIVLSIRDYDAVRCREAVESDHDNRVPESSLFGETWAERFPRATPPMLSSSGGKRTISFQTWDWDEDQEHITVELFLLEESDRDAWRIHRYKTRARALLRRTVANLLTEVGFHSVEWRFPNTTGYYQPVVVGARDLMSP